MGVFTCRVCRNRFKKNVMARKQKYCFDCKKLMKRSVPSVPRRSCLVCEKPCFGFKHRACQYDFKLKPGKRLKQLLGKGNFCLVCHRLCRNGVKHPQCHYFDKVVDPWKEVVY